MRKKLDESIDFDRLSNMFGKKNVELLKNIVSKVKAKIGQVKIDVNDEIKFQGKSHINGVEVWVNNEFGKVKKVIDSLFGHSKSVNGGFLYDYEHIKLLLQGEDNFAYLTLIPLVKESFTFKEFVNESHYNTDELKRINKARKEGFAYKQTFGSHDEAWDFAVKNQDKFQSRIIRIEGNTPESDEFELWSRKKGLNEEGDATTSGDIAEVPKKLGDGIFHRCPYFSVEEGIFNEAVRWGKRGRRYAKFKHEGITQFVKENKGKSFYIHHDGKFYKIR